MTPNDIATDISGLGPADTGSINWSTMPTFCFSGGAYVADDQRSSD